MFDICGIYGISWPCGILIVTVPVNVKPLQSTGGKRLQEETIRKSTYLVLLFLFFKLFVLLVHKLMYKVTRN